MVDPIVLHPRQHEAVNELPGPERQHRCGDNPPGAAEYAFIGGLPVPPRGRRHGDHDSAHKRHENQRAKAHPHTAPGIGISVNLGQHVTDYIRQWEEQDARAEGVAAKRRKLARPDQVRQQQDRDERRHHIVEIAEMAARTLGAVDLLDGLAHGTAR
jgi:hypothetical protein